MASLRKRPGSNQWVCCYTQPDGTRTQKSTKQTDRKKALIICLDWETAANRARNQEFTEAQARRVVSEICERAGLGAIEFTSAELHITRWIDSKETTKSAGTTTRYRHIVEAFLTHLGDRKTKSIQNITPQDISSFRDAQLKEGKSASTANMALKTLRIVLNVARRQGLIPTNPAVPCPAPDKVERSNWSERSIPQVDARRQNLYRGRIRGTQRRQRSAFF